MIHDLKHLEASKLIQLQEALPLIAILVGKADGELDVKELDLAKKIAHIRTYSSPEYLKEFYEEVEAQFDALIDKFNTELPEDADSRGQIISDRLSQLNSILGEINPKIGSKLYKGFLRFAKEIAGASGGFLGFMAVNAAESKWVGLPIITPVIQTELEEEEEE